MFARWLAPKNTTMKITTQHKIVWACKAEVVWTLEGSFHLIFPILNSLHRSFILASSNPNNKAFDQSWQKINYTYHLWKVIQQVIRPIIQFSNIRCHHRVWRRSVIWWINELRYRYTNRWFLNMKDVYIIAGVLFQLKTPRGKEFLFSNS